MEKLSEGEGGGTGKATETSKLIGSGVGLDMP